MREHEAERARAPGRWHPWLKRITNAAAHLSAVSLLASGVASSLAARKNKGRDDRSGADQSDRDRARGDRNQDSKSENDRKEERKLERENNDKAGRDSDGDSRDNDRGRNREHQDEDATDVEGAASKKQEAKRSQEAEQTNEDPEDPGDAEDPEDTEGPGGGGNRAGNAGSELFDSPLATKARRRANDFENAGREEDEGTFADVQSDGESVYETNSIALITGPDGLEIETGNITYFAEPTPTPEPLPTLEITGREPGFPFGEDFPFGNATVSVGPATREPSDPGDTGTTTDTRAKFFPTESEPSSDGGDNTMDFTS